MRGRVRDISPGQGDTIYDDDDRSKINDRLRFEMFESYLLKYFVISDLFSAPCFFINFS